MGKSMVTLPWRGLRTVNYITIQGGGAYDGWCFQIAGGIRALIVWQLNDSLQWLAAFGAPKKQTFPNGCWLLLLWCLGILPQSLGSGWHNLLTCNSSGACLHVIDQGHDMAPHNPSIQWHMGKFQRQGMVTISSSNACIVNYNLLNTTVDFGLKKGTQLEV